MIKLKLSNGKIEIFNLKSFEREKALYCAWHAMQGDEVFKSKLFRITTRTGEKLEIKLPLIKECVFEECEHVQGEVHGFTILKKKNEKARSR